MLEPDSNNLHLFKANKDGMLLLSIEYIIFYCFCRSFDFGLILILFIFCSASDGVFCNWFGARTWLVRALRRPHLG